jgi:antitoxin MazE
MESLTLKVRKIGNSEGIVIPKKYLNIVKTENETVKIDIDDNGILIKTASESPRKGWAKSFKKMRKKNDDELLMPDVFKDEKFEEWK